MAGNAELLRQFHEARSRRSLLNPDMAADMHAIFSKLWQETPLE
jgi:hypothetical protein